MVLRLLLKQEDLITNLFLYNIRVKNLIFNNLNLVLCIINEIHIFIKLMLLFLIKYLFLVMLYKYTLDYL